MSNKGAVYLNSVVQNVLHPNNILATNMDLAKQV